MPRQKAPGHLYSVYMTSYANGEVIHRNSQVIFF